jgi:hypothetical protein
MSSRNWFGYSKPLTVYYKMVGGGASEGFTVSADLPQMGSAGGSTAILKNGALVAVARGMDAANVGSARQVVSGSFTVTNTDTLQFVLGGGAGGTGWAQSYSGVWNSYAMPGGGGAGYYGGGAGSYTYSCCNVPIPATAATATGGTGIAGGTGAGGNGGFGFGGGSVAAGGNGTSTGASYGVQLWNGYFTMNYYSGGGGGYGQPGAPGGNPNSYVALGCPAYPPSTNRTGTPLATSFDLDPFSGAVGPRYGYTDWVGYINDCHSGGGPGEIVLQYEAPTCDIIPHWNQP